jgi:hypothetical protein
MVVIVMLCTHNHQNPLNVHPNESKTAGPTSVKQMHIQEGSLCPSSASHRPKTQRRCGAREKGSHRIWHAQWDLDSPLIFERGK